MDILKNNLHYWISFIAYFDGGREFTSEKDPNPSKNEFGLFAQWFFAYFSVGRSSILRPLLNGVE